MTHRSLLAHVGGYMLCCKEGQSAEVRGTERRGHDVKGASEKEGMCERTQRPGDKKRDLLYRSLRGCINSTPEHITG